MNRKKPAAPSGGPRRQVRPSASLPRRCEHCGALLGENPPQVGGKIICPNCQLPLGPEHYA